ncbi:hypothetical protein PAEPH01_0559 [Pancytospora epiphaga]|nr:hypothetical protein PAEPH01_0559 [Pancytospora epiphaga]
MKIPPALSSSVSRVFLSKIFGAAMAKKRVLSFQTPKKKVNTPLRTSKRPEPVADAGIETIENKLIEAYRKENALLRSMKADTLLYNKLLGITITEEKSLINFAIERASSSGPKKLRFHLEEKENVYVFKLEDVLNCNVPEYFYDVIEFDKSAFPLFFFKAMQAVYETRVNE